VTIERLAELLEENPRGLLMARDELSSWVFDFTRYRANGSNLPIWLGIHNAQGTTVDRKGDGRRVVDVSRAVVSVFGTIQPATFRRVLATRELIEAGLLGRFLLAQPPVTKSYWSEATINEELHHGYLDLVWALLRLNQFEEDNQPPTARPLFFSPDGKAAFVRLNNEIEDNTPGPEDPLRYFYDKLSGTAARLALVHHVVTHVGRDDRDADIRIGPASVEAAGQLARWFAHEARRLYGQLAETEAERVQRQLVEMIVRRGGSITAYELRHNSQSRYKTTAAAIEALDALAKAGRGQWTEQPTTAKGGRPTKVFTLGAETRKRDNPLESDSTEAADLDGTRDNLTTTRKPPHETPEKQGYRFTMFSRPREKENENGRDTAGELSTRKPDVETPADVITLFPGMPTDDEGVIR
jgi:hypothetical protein